MSEITIADAFETLKRAIHNDPEYAWGWHCNLAMPVVDAANASIEDANETAALMMRQLFDYDITTHQNYGYGKSIAQEYFELRVAAERMEQP